MIDREAVAAFLRLRRESLQPEDVGLARGQRRRTHGLRREEVAALSNMSTDYYARLERATGPHPSEQMIASISQGLHLSLDERNHLFRLAGHTPPTSGPTSDHIGPGLLRILDRLSDTPAEIITESGETLRQSPLAVLLTGDASLRRGADRNLGYRWFTDPAAQQPYPMEERAHLSRLYASGLRELVALRGPASHAAQLVEMLHDNAEFAAVWQTQEVGVRPPEIKRFLHPSVGRLDLHCHTLVDPDQSHRLLVYTATPGSESYERLQLLSVVGSQMISP